MKHIFLEQLQTHALSHRAVIWWLSLLYRRPQQFCDALKPMPPVKQVINGVILYLHCIPYIILSYIVGRIFFYGLLELSPASPQLNQPIQFISYHFHEFTSGLTLEIMAGIGGGIASGIALGAALGIAAGITTGIVGGIAGGIALGIATGVGMENALGFAGGIIGGFFTGIIEGTVIGIVLGIAAKIAFNKTLGITTGIIAGIIAGFAEGIALGFATGTVYGITFGFAFGLAFCVAGLRAYYLLLHLIFIFPKPRGYAYLYHPVSWDDLCSITFPWLDRLLINYTEYKPEAGAKEIERVINTYPSQRMEALKAKATLIAREAKRETNLSLLDSIVGNLPEGEEGFLSQTPKIREMISEISQLQRRLDTLERPVFREPIADYLRTKIENFEHRISGFKEPLMSEFRAAAQEWRVIADEQWKRAKEILKQEPTPQIFRAGDPVNRSQEAFVLRASVIEELERQLMLASGCPGILFYGRRRMGKSTILRNLSDFLTPTVRVISISMQKPEAFTSMESFFQLIVQEMKTIEPEIEKIQETPYDLPSFSKFLSACDQIMGALDGRLFIALDEYENIDEKIGDSAFTLDLLATFRESIQTNRRLIWAFAGSHHITELKHAQWPSYLISVRTVEIPPFTEFETRLLLTEPMKHSPIWEREDSKRPRFDPSFWGEGGIERIHTESGGWPHLTQLIAETIIDLLNDEEADRVTPDLLERSLDKAIVRGDSVLYQLIEGECVYPGEWEYLNKYRNQETQFPPEDEEIAKSLKRRALIREENNEWSLRVPLMQRWLRKRI